MTDVRKEFEAWYASKWDFEQPDFAMQTMWFAYQAAAESRDARIAELETALRWIAHHSPPDGSFDLKSARVLAERTLRGEG